MFKRAVMWAIRCNMGAIVWLCRVLQIDALEINPDATEELKGRISATVADEIARFTSHKFKVYDADTMLLVLDIVQPEQHSVVLAESPDRIDYLKTTDQTHWVYEALDGVKSAVTRKFYWEQIWTAWEIDFTGIGLRTYCTTGFDVWKVAADSVLVYQGADVSGAEPARVRRIGDHVHG